MNYSMIRYILGSVVGIEGILLLCPMLVGLIYREREAYVYGLLGVICMAVGVIMHHYKPKSRAFFAREGFVSVSLSWVVLSLIGALPFYFTREIPRYIDALFETISGFTTTGASIMTDVEILCRSTAFWRCFTHWAGGMGVLVLIMAVLPLSEGSSLHLMKAESPGPSVGKLVPKLRKTAIILYGIYFALTVLEAILLLCTGMSLYDSITLSVATAGTGGFALLNSSIGGYTIATQAVVSLFMLVFAVNFNAYYFILIKKPKEAFAMEEVRWFFVIAFGSAALIAWNIRDLFDNIGLAFHHALFQVGTVMSTTGFATQDFNLWPEFSRALLVILMFVGACAGSTGGGFKVSRLLICVKAVKNEIATLAHPRSVHHVKLDKKPIGKDIVRTALCYLAVYVFIIIGSVLLVSFDGHSFTTNFTAVMATLNNIGPGLDMVGATGNYSAFSDFSKFVLMFDMLAGRLELFPMLVLFVPDVWRVKGVIKKL